MTSELEDPWELCLPHREVTMTFRHIVRVGERAEFRMGQRGWSPDEEPVHSVSLREPYALGVFPVTQEQFAVWTDSEEYRTWFAGTREQIRESSAQGEADPHQNHFADRSRHPADSVTWWEAQGYAQWLTACGVLPAGWAAALPSEGQWEYACRGGTATDYWSGNGEEALAGVAWYGGNAGGTTHEVGQKSPNPFGLYDVHGNVAEWCQDYYDARRYRKRVEGDAGRAFLDAEGAETQGVDPRFEALAGAMARYAEGRRTVLPEDRPSLELLRALADGIIENGDSSWQSVSDAIHSAQRPGGRGAWPEQAAGIAQQLQGMLESLLEGQRGEEPRRVLRGGSWGFTANWCRSAYRGRNWAGNRFGSIGFRVCLVCSPAVQAEGPEAEGAARPAARRDDAAPVEADPGAGGMKRETKYSREAHDEHNR